MSWARGLAGRCIGAADTVPRGERAVVQRGRRWAGGTVRARAGRSRWGSKSQHTSGRSRRAMGLQATIHTSVRMLFYRRFTAFSINDPGPARYIGKRWPGRLVGSGEGRKRVRTPTSKCSAFFCCVTELD
eukprot:4900485-Prymnesium_polylepis.1